MMALSYTETRVRQSEVLQLLLLDALYGHSGSQHIIFQGGTALRWVYGGPRFSEDLDFVTRLPPDKIQSILKAVITKASRACIAQFGVGRSEQQIKGNRATAVKTFFIYRPDLAAGANRRQDRIRISSAGPNPRFSEICFQGSATGIAADGIGTSLFALFQRHYSGGDAGRNSNG